MPMSGDSSENPSVAGVSSSLAPGAASGASGESVAISSVSMTAAASATAATFTGGCNKGLRWKVGVGCEVVIDSGLGARCGVGGIEGLVIG